MWGWGPLRVSWDVPEPTRRLIVPDSVKIPKPPRDPYARCLLGKCAHQLTAAVLVVDLLRGDGPEDVAWPIHVE